MKYVYYKSLAIVEAELDKLPRFAHKPTVFYRSSVGLHARRLEHVVELLKPVLREAYPRIDTSLVKAIARHHDDPEVITGDVLLKTKQLMTPTDKDELKTKEYAAIRRLSDETGNPLVGAYGYETVLFHAHHKVSVESHIVSLLDKIDGMCEAVHDMLAGNQTTTNTAKWYGTQHIPDEIIYRYLGSLAPLLDQDHPLFSNTRDVTILAPPTKITPHSVTSLRKKSGFAVYDAWKEINLRNPAMRRWMTTMTEKPK